MASEAVLNRSPGPDQVAVTAPAAPTASGPSGASPGMGAAGTACRCAASAPDHHRRSPPAADRPRARQPQHRALRPDRQIRIIAIEHSSCGPPCSSSGPPGEKIVLDRQPADLGVKLLDLPIACLRRGGGTILACGATLLALAAGGAAVAAERQPSVVELFTSQGCSSCPTANANLARISDAPGVLALSFGVTYWDRLGEAARSRRRSWSADRQASSATTWRRSNGSLRRTAVCAPALRRRSPCGQAR